MTKNATISIVISTVLLLLSLPVAAADWEHFLSLYGVAASVDGDATVRDIEQDIDIDFGDVLDKLEMGGMARYRGQTDKMSVVADGIFLGLGAGGVDLDMMVLDCTVGYRFNDVVEGFAGLRYTHLKLDLSFSGPFEDHRWVASKELWDPIIGVRALAPLGERWNFHAHGDIGGFGVGTDLTWKASLAIGFDASEKVSLWLGYLALAQEFDIGANERLGLDIIYNGPQLGVVFKF